MFATLDNLDIMRNIIVLLVGTKNLRFPQKWQGVIFYPLLSVFGVIVIFSAAKTHSGLNTAWSSMRRYLVRQVGGRQWKLVPAWPMWVSLAVQVCFIEKEIIKMSDNRTYTKSQAPLSPSNWSALYRRSRLVSHELLKANNAQQASGVGDKRFYRFKRNVQHLWTAIIRHHVNDITVKSRYLARR